MNAIMNKTKNGKLIAVIAIFAMIACCLAIAVPSEATVTEPESYSDAKGMNQEEFLALDSDKDGIIFISTPTTWNLTGNIDVDNIKLVLTSNLLIQNTGTNAFTFSIAYDGIADDTNKAAAITTGTQTSSDANLKFVNVTATIDDTTTEASWAINSAVQGLNVFVQKSTLNVNKTAEYVDGVGAIWQTGTGNTTLTADANSIVSFNSNGQGIQGLLMIANGTTVNANVKAGTMCIYADFTDVDVRGTNVGFYAADLKQGTNVNVTGNIGIYGGSGDNAFSKEASNLTMKTVEMDESSMTAKAFINALSTNEIGIGSSVAITGGSISGSLTAVTNETVTDATFNLTNVATTNVTMGDNVKAVVTGDNAGDVVAEIPSTTIDIENAVSSKFTAGATVVEVQGGTIDADVSGISGKLVLGSGVTIATTENGEPTVTFTLANGGSISNDFNNDSFMVSSSDNSKVTFTGFSGDVEVKDGSVVIGDYSGSIESGSITLNSGAVKIFGSISGDLTIKAAGGYLMIDDETGESGATLTVEDGATLTLDGFSSWDLSFDGTGYANEGSNLEILGTITIIDGGEIKTGNNNNTITTYPSTNLNGVTLGGNVEYKTDNIAYEFKGMLDQDITVSTEQSLTGDLWIPDGVTLTIASGGVLNMAGYGIYVQGTLDVQANGAIKNIGNGYNDGTVGLNGQILLYKDGTITNDGVIGSGSEVTVSADIKQKSETPAYDGTLTGAGLEVNYNGVGSVTMQNVTGVAFSVNTDGDNRVLTISGEAYSYGISAPYSISASGVNIEKTMTIGEDVTFKAAGAVSIKSGATLNIEGTVVSDGNIVMKNGSTVNVEGTIDEITAETGNFVTAQKYKDGSTKVTFTNVTGVVLTVGQTTYTEKNTSYTNQILYIAGNPSIVSDTAKVGTLTVDNTDKGISYVAEDVKIVLDEGVTFNMGGTEVFGEVSYPKVNTPATGASDFVGTEYTIKGATASDDDVVYITTFANAYSQIANADKTTIKVWGKLTIDFDVTLAEKQTIDIREATVEIDADATVVVQRNGAIINNSIEDVQGVLTVYNGGNVKQPANYAVYKKTTDYVQYSGLVPAINNAQPGDVIDVRNSTTVKDDLTIPAGVTVNNKATLTFMEDLTVAETAVLNNEGTIYMAGEKSTVTVEGTFDNKDGSTFGFYDVSGEAPVLKTENAKGENRALYSTGTTIMDEATRLNIDSFANAAYYNDEDGNVVLTTVAKAVAAVEAQDAGEQSVTIMGTVNQSENITLADGTVVIVLSGAKATLGTVTLSSGAVIASYGELTATITGQTGVEGSTIDSTIELSKAGALIGMISHTSNDNVTTDYLVMFDGIKGDVTISAGKVNVLNSVDENDATIKFTVNGTTLNVSEGATLAVEKIGDMNATLVAGVGEKADQPSIIVDGTLLFDDGSLEAYASGQHITVNGTMTVADETEITIDGTVEIIGTLAVSTTEDKAGVVSIADDGVLIVGDKPTDLGVAGSGVVSGAVESDNGIIKAYNGADLSGAQIDVVSGESEAKSTAFYINGELYMTVYSCNVRQVADIVGNEEFDIVGYVTERDSTSNPLDIRDLQYWYTDAEMSQKADKVTDLGSPEALYFKAPAAQVTISVSVGEGISLYIDDVRQVTNSVTLAVGTHTVSATVDPGFKGEVAVTFNGVAVNGTFTITPEMASNAYDGPLAISAAGNITQDSTVVIDGGNTGSDMGLTDYLLIVLVILIVIMAIIVALRLMRS